MRTSISNLNGEQQNRLHHLNKVLKRAIKPSAIICYGHRTQINFQHSAFLKSGDVKTNTSVFDIFLMISDDEPLPDTIVLKIAKRCFPKDIAGNIIVARMQEVLSGFRKGSRFFAGIFKKGIVLHGNSNVIQVLTGHFPPAGYFAGEEKQLLSSLLQQAQQQLLRAERSLKAGLSDTHTAIAGLHESVIFSLRYFIAAYWGTDLKGDCRTLLKCTANTNIEFSRVFPCNTTEETILLDLINLSLIDKGFCPGEQMLRTLSKRASAILALSQRHVQRKFA
jgi:hypothetical protein